MTGIDWLIIVFTLLLAFYGYLQGFIVGALSLLGFAVGAFLGTRLGPLLLPSGSHSQYAPLFGLIGALLAGGMLASGLEGLGVHARSALRLPGLRTVDGLLGAGLTACVGLGIAWIIGAVALESSGSQPLRADIQRSAILKELNQLLPPSGPILHALARFDPLPSVRGPAAAVPAPTRGILATHGVRAARPSVVRVLGSACGLGVEGSGWVAAPELVVTNAHVVAGETDTTVERGGEPGSGLAAHAVVFDPHDDIAVLRVPGLNEPALPLAAGVPSGTAAGILGYPLDGAYDAEPGRVGQTQVVATQDAYGNPTLRSIVTLRGRVRPGNSGGPMVDTDGQVVATVFAAITGGGRGGFAVPNALVRRALGAAARMAAGFAVGTGPCAG